MLTFYTQTNNKNQRRRRRRRRVKKSISFTLHHEKLLKTKQRIVPALPLNPSHSDTKKKQQERNEVGNGAEKPGESKHEAK